MTNNPSKFYFWVKKLQNGPKSDKQSVKKKFLVKKLQNGPKSEKLSVEILYLLKINKTD